MLGAVAALETRRLWHALFACAVLAVFPQLAFADAPPENVKKPILSACEHDYPPFCITESGKADGFSVELFTAAVHAMGRDVHFRLGSWAKVKAALEKGEIEALPLVGRTPERENVFDFTVPYLSLHGAIVVREDTDNIHSLADLRGKQVAVMKGDNAEEFVRRANLGATVITTGTFTDALKELATGRHDAVIVQRLLCLQILRQNGITNLRVVGGPLEEFKQDFCFAVREGDRETLSLLNEGLAIVVADGTFRRLQKKWFGPIERMGRDHIMVGGDYDYPPYEFLDEKGQPAGYNVELTRAIARQVGVTARIRLGPWADIRKRLLTGEIDLIQGMFYSSERDKQVDFSQAHTVIHHVAVVRKGDVPPADVRDLGGKRLVIMRGDIMHDFAVKHSLQDHVTLVETLEEALRQLADGQHDCALLARVPALYWIQKRGWDNLRVSDMPMISPEYCYAALPENRDTLDEFRDGLAALKQTGEYRAIYDKWLGGYAKPELTFWTIARYALIVVAPLLVILAGALLWSMSLNRQVARRTGELRRETALLEAQLNSTLDGILIVDENGKKIVQNQRAIDLWQTPQHIADSDDDEKDLQHAKELAVNPEEFIEKVHDLYTHPSKTSRDEVELKNGSILDRYSAPVLGKDGRHYGRIWTFRDITRRKQSEEKVKASEARLREVLDASPFPIAVADAEDNNIHYWSKSALALFGHTPPNTAEWYRIAYPDPDYRREVIDRWRPFLQAARASGSAINTGEYHITCQDGSVRICEIYAAARADILIVTFNDITERKRTEDALRKSEERLRQTEKMQAIGQLAGGIAHDFNNQLTGVLGYADMLANRLENPELLHYAENIKKASKRAAELTQQLLAFGRKGKNLSIPVEIHRIISDVSSMMERSFDKRIRIAQNLSAQCAIVTGDPTQIHNALLNLGLNARDAMPEGGELLFETKTIEMDDSFIRNHFHDVTPGPYVRIAVTDTGIGMTADTQKRIFEPFFTTKEPGQGTGLGLASVYGTIKNHGGAINVYSEVGHGTTFHLYLPLSASAESEEKEASRAVIKGTEHILIVDDEEMVRELAADMLHELGYQVTTCEDGKTALEVYRDSWQNIDLVLLDMIMPDLDGRDTFAAMREINPDIRAILSSGYSINGKAQAILDEGVKAFVGKPFDQAELSEAVAYVLRGGGYS